MNIKIELNLMRTMILILSIAMLTSCGAYKQASYVSNQCYIGMTIQEFKSVAGKKASLEAMESGYTVYRINDYDVWTGAKTNTSFYYFDSNGKLVKIDGGEFKQKRYQIEYINN
jgi:hypothetical protein